LASGRLTPLSRIALVTGLGLFVALVLLVQPVHRPEPSLVPVPASVRALDRESVWVERATLEEGSSLFMPAPQADVVSTDAAQPDAAPFSSFGPEYRHDPARPLSLASSVTTTRWKTLDEAFPLSEERPFATIGAKPSRQSLKPRMLQIQVFSDINESVLQKDLSSSDPLVNSHKTLINNGLNIKSPVEIRLGIDAMGLQSKPYLLRSSGDNSWDQAVCSWAAGLPWTAWLKPGSYRVVVGP